MQISICTARVNARPYLMLSRPPMQRTEFRGSKAYEDPLPVVLSQVLVGVACLMVGDLVDHDQILRLPL